jgi:hypothetical protein
VLVFPLTRHVQRYRHLVEKLELLWGTPEFLDYVTNTALVEKERSGRSGFPPEVVDEMLSLKSYMLRNITRFPLSEQDKLRVLQYVRKHDEWGVHASPSVKATDLFKPKAAAKPQAKAREPNGKRRLFGFLWH